MRKFCCSDFTGWFEKGYIKHDLGRTPDPPKETWCCGTPELDPGRMECYRVVFENYHYYIKGENGEFRLLHLDTFLEYCPWCGTKIMKDAP